MPFNDAGVFSPAYNWEADFNANPPIGVSPVRFDGQDADFAAGLTKLMGMLSPAGLNAVMTAWAATLPTADPQQLGAPWLNNGVLQISRGP